MFVLFLVNMAGGTETVWEGKPFGIIGVLPRSSNNSLSVKVWSDSLYFAVEPGGLLALLMGLRSIGGGGLPE